MKTTQDNTAFLTTVWDIGSRSILYTEPTTIALLRSGLLLLAHLMSQYCFARWRLLSVVVVVFCNPASGRTGRARGRSAATGPANGRFGGRAADTARRASTVTSRQGDTLLL